MKGAGSKNSWVLLIFVLVGLVIGGFIGMLTQNISGLNWLNYGQTFGLDNPLVLNLGILIITFGLNIKITVCSIVGMIIAIIIYRFL